MSKYLTVEKPDIRFAYLNNMISEKVNYLYVPEEVGKQALKQDIKNSACQFREVDKYIKKLNRAHYIIIQAESKEMGLMAVTYLAGCFREEEGDIDIDDMDEDDESENNEKSDDVLGEKSSAEEKPDVEYDIDMERDFGQGEDVLDEFGENFGNKNEDEMGYGGPQDRWEESQSRIPLLDYKEIYDYFGRNAVFGVSGEFFPAVEEGRYNLKKPYWTKCTNESVCVLYKGGGMFWDSDTREYGRLDYFKNNKHVFLIFIHKEDAKEKFENDAVCLSGWEKDEMEKVKLMIKLEYLADEISLKMSEKEAKKYYETVFRTHLYKNGLSVKRGVCCDKLVKDIRMLPMKRPLSELIGKVILYAAKDKVSAGERTLAMKDFEFLKALIKQKTDEEKEFKEGFDALVGMEDIKKQVLDIINVMKYNKLRENMGAGKSAYHNVHLMLGAPGTAKTTVAKIMGNLMRKEQLLQNVSFIAVNGAELKGMYVGHSAPKVKSLFQQYGVILIDEAYSIVDEQAGTDSFGNEAIAQLLVELEEHSMDRLVIFAGYGGKRVKEKDNRMQAFLNANPGIRSRINSVMYFESYTPDEMAEIFVRVAKIGGFELESGAEPDVVEFFKKRVKDPNFGNGREARNLLEASVLAAAGRVMESGKEDFTKEELKVITCEDIRRAIAKSAEEYGVREIDYSSRIGFNVSN